MAATGKARVRPLPRIMRETGLGWREAVDVWAAEARFKTVIDAERAQQAVDVKTGDQRGWDRRVQRLNPRMLPYTVI